MWSQDKKSHLTRDPHVSSFYASQRLGGFSFYRASFFGKIKTNRGRAFALDKRSESKETEALEGRYSFFALASERQILLSKIRIQKQKTHELQSGILLNVKVEKWNKELAGPLNENALRQKLEKRGYSVSRYVYSPGTYFPDHTHTIDKIDAVLSGRLKMTMEGKSIVLQAGDCLAVPRGIVHSAEVVGSEPVVSLDATKD